MIRILSLFLFSAIALPAQTRAELREHIAGQEGYSATSYYLRGNWHIGLGHRLNHWESRWSNSKIEKAFTDDLKIACDTAYNNISNFSSHPKQIRIMLVGLAYNVGPAGFYEFYRFRAAIESFNYHGAAKELSNSLWARQLPSRAQEYISILNES